MKKLTVFFFTIVLLVILASMLIPGLLAAGDKPLSVPTAVELKPVLNYVTYLTGPWESYLIHDDTIVKNYGQDPYLMLVGGSKMDTTNPNDAFFSPTSAYLKVTVALPSGSKVGPSDAQVTVANCSAAPVVAQTNKPDESTPVDAKLGIAKINFAGADGDKSKDIMLVSSHKAVSVNTVTQDGNSIVYTLKIDKSALAAPKNPTDLIKVDLSLSIPAALKYNVLKDLTNTSAADGPIFTSSEKATLDIKFFDESLVLCDYISGGNDYEIIFDVFNERVYSDITDSTCPFVEGETYYVSVDGRKYQKFTAVLGTTTNGVPSGKTGFTLGNLLDNKNASAFYITRNPNAGKKNQIPEYVVTCTRFIYNTTGNSCPVDIGNGAHISNYKYLKISPRPKLDKEVKLGYGYNEDNPGVNSIGATPEEPKWTLVGGDGFDLNNYQWALVPSSKSAAPDYTTFDKADPAKRAVSYADSMILTAGKKNSSQAYFIRSMPVVVITPSTEQVVVPYGIPKKVTPAKQKVGPKLKVDYKKEVVKFKAGLMYNVPPQNDTDTSDPTALLYTLMTKESDFIKTGVQVSSAIGASKQKIYAYTAATAKAPPSAYNAVETLPRASEPNSSAFDTKKEGTIKLAKGYEVFDEAKQKWGGYKKGTESGHVRVKATKQKAASEDVPFAVTVTPGDKEAKTKDKYSVTVGAGAL